jgi:hypothetical protein
MNCPRCDAELDLRLVPGWKPFYQCGSCWIAFYQHIERVSVPGRPRRRRWGVTLLQGRQSATSGEVSR